MGLAESPHTSRHAAKPIGEPKGAVLLPGFVDLQVNGYLGADFSAPDLTPERAADVCRALLRQGTAAFLPTIITSPERVYQRNLPMLAEMIGDAEFSGRLLGIHLEGPFISSLPGAVGSHNPRYARPPSLAFFEQMQTWARGHIRLVTLAAELDGAAGLAGELSAQGVVVSLGHQLATPADLARLADAGARAITHLGNGMPSQVDRHANPLLAGLAEDRLLAMVIADGHHLPAHVVRVILRCKGVERLILTSDAAPIAGMPPGVYDTLGNRAILTAEGRFYNPETGYLVGSSRTLLECANWLLAQGLLDAHEIARAAYANPLALLGMESVSDQTGNAVEYDPHVNQFVLVTGGHSRHGTVHIR